MAKKKGRSPSRAAKQANRDDRPGSQGQANTPPAESRKQRRRRTWEFEMVVCDQLQPLEGHLLMGFSLEERQQARWSALGRVLASIAKRRAGQLDEPEGSPSWEGPQNNSHDGE